MSNKDPAVLFYTSDFLSGTMLMSYDQKGKYITLLCLQHQKGHLSEKDLLRVCGSYDEDIFSKFVVDELGKYYNPRMEQESEKRKKYSKSRSDNRKGSKKQHVDLRVDTYVQSYDDTHQSHMENENENRNKEVSSNIVISNTTKVNRRKFVAPTYEDVLEYAKSKGHEDLAKRFFDYFNDGDWVDSQGKKVRSWKQKFLTWCGREEKKPDNSAKPKARYGTFDPDDAFQKALERTYGSEE